MQADFDTDGDVTIEQDGSEERGASEEELEAVESLVDSKVTKLKTELEHAKKEKAEYLDGWQRAKADYVNALKRFEEEKKAAQARGTAKAVGAFIGVLDSLERAESAGDIPESFMLIAKQLHEAAKSLGIEKFGAVGEEFTPSMHEALGTDASAFQADDYKISAVLESGWWANGEVIRPAKVRIYQFMH